MSYFTAKVMTRIKAAGVVAGAIISVSAALTILGVEKFPRPAWSSEIIKLAESHVELDSRVTSQQLYDTKLQFSQNKREQSAYAPGTEPDWLIEEEIDLERKIDDLEEHLRDLRNE